MKAAVLMEVGKPLQLMELRIARPEPREVLIRTRAVGVCHSDLSHIDGKFPHVVPAVPGHEAAGVVEAVGSEVRTLKPGDHVIACLSVYCGHCEFCLSGRPFLCSSAEMVRGPGAPPRLAFQDGRTCSQMFNLSAFAEQMLVHEHACVAIDRKMPLDRAALIGCAVTTGAGAVFNAAQVRPGETVCVVGCGGIGLAAVNAARIAGAARIIAVDPMPDKRAVAEKLGATHLVDAGAENAVAEVIEASNGGVDHAIEAVGRLDSAQTTIDVLRRGGTATILGLTPIGAKIGLDVVDLLAGKKLQGSRMGSSRPPIDVPRLVDFYQRGSLDLDALIGERTGLEGINDALDKMRHGNALRSLILLPE